MSKTWKQERPCWEDGYQWNWDQNERRETKVKMTFLIYICAMFYSLNIYLLTVCICVYACMSMCTGVWMLSEARSIRSLWVWSFNLLWTSWHGFWQSNSVPLQEPLTLSTAEPSLPNLSLFSLNILIVTHARVRALLAGLSSVPRHRLRMFVVWTAMFIYALLHICIWPYDLYDRSVLTLP